MRSLRRSVSAYRLRWVGMAAMCLLIGCATPPDDEADRKLESRKKAIAQALKQTPLPAIPAEAQQHFDHGALLLRNSSGDADLIKAAAEFEECLRLAPWKADAYYNIGRLKELANDYDGAIRNYSLYLLASPNAEDARSIQNTIGELVLKKPKAGLAGLEGIWRQYLCRGDKSTSTYDMHYLFTREGKEIVVVLIFDKDNPVEGIERGQRSEHARFKLNGRKIIGNLTWRKVPLSGMVTEDFSEIYWSYQMPGSLDTQTGREVVNFETIRCSNN